MNKSKEQSETGQDFSELKGPHSAHKSPAEDAPLDTNLSVQETQKAKQKVDADVTDESEKPGRNENKDSDR